MVKNVAIIGAGLAGLSCAHELEKYGMSPVIFERNSYIGEQFTHVGAALEIIIRPINDPVMYLKNSFGLDLKPLNTVNKIIHHSPNRTYVVKGSLGYFFERSRRPDDLKVQIHSKLKNTRILFNTQADYVPLSRQFEHVVIANGTAEFTKELGCWMEWLNTYVRGATVLGDFDPNTLIVWFNKDYCKNGYAYLTPFNSKKASINLVTTDVNEKEIDFYWELFLNTENIGYTIVEEFIINHRSGLVHPLKVNNVCFAGDAAGAIDPFLGFGVANSVVSGVMAARSIAQGKDYEKLLNSMIRSNLQLYEFRKVFNSLTNSDYDRLIAFLGFPGLEHLIYHTPMNVIKMGAFILKNGHGSKSRKI